MIKLISYFLIFVFFSCSTTSDTDAWGTIDLGEFTISLPKDSKVENVKSIDSYVAKIKGNGFELMFDYGMYSPEMQPTEEEYINNGEWKLHGEFSLLSVLQPLPILNKVTKINDSTYLAQFNIKECLQNDSCIYYKFEKQFHDIYIIKDSILEGKFMIPEELKEFNFLIEKNDSIYKKIIISRELNKFHSGAYILNKNSCKDEFNCWKQLSIWTSDSTKIAKADLIRIFKSINLK